MAHRVFHRPLTAGVALVGAGALALSAVSVVPDATTEALAAQVRTAAPRAVSTEVEHAALVRYLEILATGAAATVAESLATFTTDIPALFQQIAAQWADPDLTPWNHSLAGAALFAPVAPFAVGPFSDAVVEVLAQSFSSHGDEIRENLPRAIEYAFARLVGPIISAIGATGAVHQAYYAAGMAGNPPGQWLALLSTPYHVIDGFLFGGYGDISALITGEVGGERIAAPGLLTPWGKYPVDRSVTDKFEDLPSVTSTLLPTADEPELAPVSLLTETDGTEAGLGADVDAKATDTEASEDEVTDDATAADAAVEAAEPEGTEAEVTDPEVTEDEVTEPEVTGGEAGDDAAAEETDDPEKTDDAHDTEKADAAGEDTTDKNDAGKADTE
ncbi:hypothetical protein [Mycolicibacterium sp.]|uniref:hypothetical protein n=1 Tax=Mycolicibacterium sp. TaxID=2320850 RepID=UPI003D110582